MEKLRWSENKPDKPGLWAFSRSNSSLSIDGVCFGPNTAPFSTVSPYYLFCYLGPIPTILPPPTYRQPNAESDIGKDVELHTIEYKHNPDSQKVVWQKDIIIKGYQIKYSEKQFFIERKSYGSGWWVTADKLKIME
jgi:hypothetical protein